MIYRGYLIVKESPGEGDSWYPWMIGKIGVFGIITWTHTRKEAKVLIDSILRPDPEFDRMVRAEKQLNGW